VSWKSKNGVEYFLPYIRSRPALLLLGNAGLPHTNCFGVEAGKTYYQKLRLYLGASAGGRGKERSRQVQVDRFRREAIEDSAPRIVPAHCPPIDRISLMEARARLSNTTYLARLRPARFGGNDRKDSAPEGRKHAARPSEWRRN